MSDIANLTPEESFKAGLPVVLQLEGWIKAAEEQLRALFGSPPRMIEKLTYDGVRAEALITRINAYRDALALVTAKDADRDP